MHTVSIIIVCYAGTLAAGFLLASYCLLRSLDDGERQQLRQIAAEARKKGGDREEYRVVRREVSRIPLLYRWRSRPEMRQSLWLGLFFGLVAAVAAQFI